ncbi:hypothetical protein GCM10009634_38960 [Saccharothrix xinjiangensis]
MGPVEVRVDGRPVDVGVRKQRFVLAVLLLEVNKLVPADRLVGLMWPHGPPASARAVLHTQVSKLRSMLARVDARRHGVALVGNGPGYLLEADPLRVDLHRFRWLCARAWSMDDVRRAATLAEALALWRGPVMAGLDAEGLGRGHEDERLAAVEDRFDAELRLGHHHAVVDELAALVAEHPYRQHLVRQLVLALHRCRRTDEALRCYRDLRRRLDDELGIAPSAELQRLHDEILRTGRPVVAGLPVPRQLPPDLPGFVGRAGALAALDGAAGRSVLVTAVSGAAGVGKTALAVRWAHRVKDRYPDGQLYASLRGHDPGGRELDPADVLASFLRALGIPDDGIPADPESRTALYRSLLADKAVLVVLDDAPTSAQVEPLLPASPSAAVVVTSRAALSGLVVRRGAVRLPLAVLDPPEALELMRSALGDERVDAEPGAVAELCALCGRLPLALRIAAERVGARSGQPVAALVAELRDEHARLSLLSTGDGEERAAVRAVLDWSRRALPADVRRAFAPPARHPGPTSERRAAASPLGVADATCAGRGRVGRPAPARQARPPPVPQPDQAVRRRLQRRCGPSPLGRGARVQARDFTGRTSPLRR